MLIQIKQAVSTCRQAVLLCTFSVGCWFYETNAQTIYVDSSVAVSGNGSSWVSAYKELRDALLNIRTNNTITTIAVAKGTYKPTNDTNIDSAFCIYRGNVKIYGGYPGGGGTRDFNANRVNLTGIGDNEYNTSYHVFIVAGLPVNADSVVLDGLTINGGSSISWSYEHSYNNQPIKGFTGAGLCLQNNWSGSKIAVSNCNFINNHGNTGAGIYSYLAGSLFINNCVFDSNTAHGGLDLGFGYGAGLYNYKTTASISNCLFSKNNSTGRPCTGIGLCNVHSSITVFNTAFTANSGPSNGGAIANTDSADAVISYCTFTDNAVETFFFTSESYASCIYNSSSRINLHHSSLLRNRSATGGAVILWDSHDASINNVSFAQNSALTGDSHGGGITNISSSPDISNCLFLNDTALLGGAIYNGAGSSPRVNNCTFYSNFSEFSYGAGGAIYCADSSGGRYTNCIFWKDTVRSEFNSGRYEFYSENNGSDLSKPRPAVLYSIINSPFPILNVLDSGNNSSNYPRFIDTAIATIAGADGMFGTGDDGLRLQPCSPGIDAGINSAIPAGITKDIKDDERINNNAVDLGCFENPGPIITASTTIAGNNDSTLKSIYNALDLMQDCRLLATVVPTGAAPVAGGVKVKVTINVAGSPFAKPFVQRYYEIEPSQNASLATATVSLYFTQADFDAYNLVRGSYPSLPVDASDVLNYKSNILVHQFHGANDLSSEVIIVPSVVAWNSTNNWWIASFNVTGFSRFYLNTDLTPLPVVLNYFKGQRQDNHINLNWKTDCAHSSGLTLSLEKSKDGNAFTSIYHTIVNEQRCILPFNYTDNDPFPGKNYYRLKMTETAGKIFYSNILFFSARPSEVFVSPTIIKQGQLLNVAVQQKDYVFAIYNSNGALVKKQKLVQGVNTIPVTIAAGIYFYRIADSDEQSQKTGKIIID
ncbi:MAG: T9SS type A sorting domain-containing protein [Ferruginibacter sp.]